jgi:hypothetical protein
MAGKAKFYFLSGKVRWFKHRMPNKFGSFSHSLYLNPESLDLFKKLKEKDGERLGIQTEIKQDEDGYFVNISRPASRVYGGKVVTFAPPVILDKNNNTLYDVMIGDGSDVTTKVQWYPFKFGNKLGSAIRWESSRIENLVPQNEDRSILSPEEEKQVKGLEDQPLQQDEEF